MKVEKLEIYKKQLLLTLSGVFVLLSNTAVAADSSGQFQNAYEVTSEHRRTVGASKSVAFEIGLDTKQEKTTENSSSTMTGSETSTKASIFGCEFGGSSKEERTRGSKTGSLESISGSMKAGTKVGIEMTGAAGHSVTFKGALGDSDAINSGFSVLERTAKRTDIDIERDRKAAYQLTDTKLMTKAVTEVSTGLEASKKMHTMFSQTAGSSGKSTFGSSGKSMFGSSGKSMFGSSGKSMFGS